MPDFTQYKKLELPKSIERYSVQVFNKNNMIIDSELHKIDIKNQSQDNLLATKEALNAEISRATRSEEVTNNSLQGHISNKTNPHNVTKGQIGLSNVDNTSDLDKPVSTAQQNALNSTVSNHNTSTSSHNDMRILISELTTRLNALADSDDTTLDQLSEIVTYIKNNRTLIDSITTSKVSISDIVDNLTSTATNKPLSARQGQVLKSLITELTTTVGNKVDKVSGKGLSTNDYTTEEKNKLNSITTNATANSPSSTIPKANGTANVGTESAYARGDHVHPLQTTISGNADTATKWATARIINGLSVQGDINRINYGTCSTAAATAAKVVACAGYVLITGSKITVRFTVTNTAANPTLNVNNTGAKPMFYRGFAIAAGYLAANRVYTFRYNGTQYDYVGDLNTNTWQSCTKDSEGYVSKGNGQVNKVWKTDAGGNPGWRYETTIYNISDGNADAYLQSLGISSSNTIQEVYTKLPIGISIICNNMHTSNYTKSLPIQGQRAQTIYYKSNVRGYIEVQSYDNNLLYVASVLDGVVNSYSQVLLSSNGAGIIYSDSEPVSPYTDMTWIGN